MLIPYKPSEDSKMGAIAWGDVSSDPYYSRVGSNEISKTNLYLRYDSYKDESTGKWNGRTIQCEFWRELADTACKLEKKDRILVFGTLAKDDFKSEKSGTTVMILHVDFFLPQALVNVFIDGIDNKNGLFPPEDTSNIPFDDGNEDLLF